MVDVEAFRREVRDKLAVARHAASCPVPNPVVVLKQCEDFLVDLYVEATREPPAPKEAYLDVVFDGPPSHVSGRFVEVENPAGASVKAGWWIDRGNGLWALRIPLREPPAPDVQALQEAVKAYLVYLHDASLPLASPEWPTVRGRVLTAACNMFPKLRVAAPAGEQE